MDKVLRQLQLTQLEILKVIDEFCRTYNLKYSLYAGTLIGAVRHKGFIPWDDDLDIAMEREEYDRFIKLWLEHQPNGYVLTNKDHSPKFPSSFTKIRKDHTTFLHNEEDRGQFHTGIFVDVFPIDRVPTNKFLKYNYYWNYMRYHLYSREFVPPKENAIVKLVSRIMLWIVRPPYREQKRQMLLKKITKYNGNKQYNRVDGQTVRLLRIDLPTDLMDAYVDLPFEDGVFMCFKDWDAYLKCIYNDYMQMPPERERLWKHHPIIVDFEHNLEEITDETATALRFQNQ